MKAQLACVLALAACGGNWSNTDLEFLAALPRKADLQVTLPGGAAATQALTQRSDPLMVGEVSTGYAEAKRAAQEYNGALDAMLNSFESIRAYPPTSRTSTVRTWGPYADSENPNFAFEVLVSRTDSPTRFDFQVSAQKTQGDRFDIVTGYVDSGGEAEPRIVLLNLHARAARQLPNTPTTVAQFDHVALLEVTRSTGRFASMAYGIRIGGDPNRAVYYDYQRAIDHAEVLSYPGSSGSEYAAFDTSWNADGAGRTRQVITEGGLTGATSDECWDANQRVTYVKQTWPEGSVSGAVADCVELTGF